MESVCLTFLFLTRTVSFLYRAFFLFEPLLSRVGLQPSSSMSTGCVVPLRGDWAIFRHASWLRPGWTSVISQGKTLEILRHGWELNPGHGKTDSEIHSFFHWAIRADFRTERLMAHNLYLCQGLQCLWVVPLCAWCLFRKVSVPGRLQSI